MGSGEREAGARLGISPPVEVGTRPVSFFPRKSTIVNYQSSIYVERIEE
jgi:hypothetical protein